MVDQPELTLEELLREPMILTLMERDGYTADDIRLLARQVTTAASARPGVMRSRIPYRAAPSWCGPSACA
ncbi:hypothetical protein [Aminobacter sp. HY435]|uniref:hypothetical protein n=1 Tax=Aminobacter sp. HY435 TaxID=2970917 RepID=UPI0022B9ABD2|nr:hypothetical protein [Aminobacter sp. HY435]